MDSLSFASSLPMISYRIATEPGFVKQLRSFIQVLRLDTGQSISQEEAAVLTAYLDREISISKNVADMLIDPSEQETWIG